MNGPWNEKTGHPWDDNKARNTNRALRRHMQAAFHIRSAGRRRRKQLSKVTRSEYVALTLAVMRRLSERGREDEDDE